MPRSVDSISRSTRGASWASGFINTPSLLACGKKLEKQPSLHGQAVNGCEDIGKIASGRLWLTARPNLIGSKVNAPMIGMAVMLHQCDAARGGVRHDTLRETATGNRKAPGQSLKLGK
jgi:hypothetical protein